MTAAEEIYPGILRIELPLPFELASVNVHLVRVERGYMLIDCGMDIGASFSVLELALRDAGIAWSDIRRILLTHTHPDHVGMSAKILAATGAELLMHAVELRQLQLVMNPPRRALWIDRAFSESGVPEGQQAEMQDYFRIVRRNFHDLAPDVLLQGGETVETALGPLDVIWTPGHAPGHVCLYSRQHRVLISGDQILPDITPNIPWLPDADPLADFMEALGGLKHLDVDLIVPSHGRPFTGHSAWIDETVQHHHERCDELRGLLNRSPQTAHALVGQLWTRKLSPINQQFALLEVLAHLEYLRRRGGVNSYETGGVFQWVSE